MRGVIVAVAAIAGLAPACAGADSVARPIDDVDMVSWRSELAARPLNADELDMDAMYQRAVEDCDASVDDLMLTLAAPSVDPTIVAVGLRYVCPGQENKVNEALRELQNARSAVDSA